MTTNDSNTANYVFEASDRARIGALEELCDEGTVRLLSRLGVGPGWHCLEVGAGGGSIARQLANMVTERGRVVATDLDTRYLGEPGPPIEVRRHDIVRDPLEEQAFDLVHARLVLSHLPERAEVLQRLVAALRPGGYLLIEDIDYVSAVAVSEKGAAEHEHSQAVRLKEFAGTGMAQYLGRTLPATLRAEGLVEVGHEGRVFVMEGGSPGARWFKLSMAHLRARLVGPGKLTDDEVDQMLTLFDDPDWAAWSPIFLAAWGRKPS